MSSLEKDFGRPNFSESQELPNVTPNVSYSPELDDAPYILGFDTEKFVSLLRDAHNVSDERISQLSVLIEKNIGGTTLAQYNPINHKFSISGDRLWETYLSDLAKAKKIINRRKGLTWDYFELVHKQKRFSKYLTYAPEERAERFSSRFLMRAANSDADTTILHESSHIGDSQKLHKWSIVERFAKLAPAPLLGGGALIYAGENLGEKSLGAVAGLSAGIFFDFMLVVSGSYRLLDSAEIRARRFEKQGIRNHNWRGILTISNKKPIETI